MSGAGAGIAVSIVTCPLDVIKTRLQNQNTQTVYRGTINSFYKVWIEEGFRGLYRGLEPTLLGYLPTWAIYFSAYHKYKSFLVSSTDLTKDSSVLHLWAACMAGVTSTVITSPLWVIRTRFMSYKTSLYINTFDAFRKIYRTEGFMAFYKGLVPSLFGISHVAIQFPLYEKLKLYFICKNEGEGLSSLDIIIASCISKIVASSATYPHEVIRTRLQNQLNSGVLKYDGIWNTIKVIFKEEGFFAFYKGINANLIRVIPSSAISFLTYELLLSLLNDKWPT